MRNYTNNMDFLLPFVTSDDPKWQEDILRYTKHFEPNRFRDYGTLKYLFRGVEKYMPFIDRIVLLVAYPSQVPQWVNRKTVKVVTHKDIMPKSVLPTFNSSVIECYINNIADLSERFIYSNDDMFPIGPLTEECFFRDGKPVINYTKRTLMNSSFLEMCKNTNDLAAELAGVGHDAGFIKPAHFHTPMLKSVNLEIVRKAGDRIRKSASRFRKPYNLNQYLYQDYYVYAGLSVSDENAYKAKRISYDHPSKTIEIVHDLLRGEYAIYCINDEYWWRSLELELEKIHKGFERLFPNKCRYEK